MVLLAVGCKPEQHPTSAQSAGKGAVSSNQSANSRSNANGNRYQPLIGKWKSETYAIVGSGSIKLITNRWSDPDTKKRPPAGRSPIPSMKGLEQSGRVVIQLEVDAAAASLGGGRLMFDVETAEGNHYQDSVPVIFQPFETGFRVQGMISGLTLTEQPGADPDKIKWKLSGTIKAFDIDGYPFSPAKLDVMLSRAKPADQDH